MGETYANNRFPYSGIYEYVRVVPKKKKTKRRKANWLRSRQVLRVEGGVGIGYDRKFGNTNELETRDEFYKGNG